ncbi:hypothetical protein [Desulfobacter curvatus]|uniref:hypothetical protein n=1 Tax=Desulfobacter curvatus TaxID=2290 RepID=UPI000363B164|nr:hypothetical protein [Desulfobacter curvatus]
MKIDELEEIQLSDYVDYGNLDREKIVLVCTKEYSDYHTNILPILVLKDNIFYKIKDNPKTIMYNANFRERGEEKRELLTQRFLSNELFRVTAIVENLKDSIELPFFAFGDKTVKLRHEVHESYSGSFDLENDYFIPDQPGVYELLKDKNESGQNSYFYVDSKKSILGPFNFNGTDGEKIKLAAIHNNSGYIYEWEITQIKSLFVDFETNTLKGETLNRKLIAEWLPTEQGRKIKFLPNDELLNFILKNANSLNIFSKQELNTFKKVHNAFSGADFSDINQSIYTRAQNLFDKSKNNKDLLEDFLSFLPETETFKDQISDYEEKKNDLSNEISDLEKKKEDLDLQISELREDEKERIQKLDELKNQYENLRKEQIEAEMEAARIQNEDLKALFAEKEKIQEELQKIEKYQ